MKRFTSSSPNDETSVRLAHNSLLPDLRFNGFYSSSGLGGNQFDTTTTPPTPVSQTGFGNSVSQVCGFSFPSYGFTVTLNLPVKNHSAPRTLVLHWSQERRNLYLDRQQNQAITLEVAIAMHQLEQSKFSMASARFRRDLGPEKPGSRAAKVRARNRDHLHSCSMPKTYLAQTEQSLLQAEIGYNLAVTAVDHATGGLLARHHVQIEQDLSVRGRMTVPSRLFLAPACGRSMMRHAEPDLFCDEPIYTISRLQGGEEPCERSSKNLSTRGNVLDMAIGLAVALAFGKIVTSFVSDILMPPIGLILGRVDFNNLFIDISEASTSTRLAAAKAAGAATINYGTFLTTIIDFLIVAFMMFLMVKQVNRFKPPEPVPVAAHA